MQDKKEKVITFRVTEKVYQDFKFVCEKQYDTVSGTLNKFVNNYSNKYKSKLK